MKFYLAVAICVAMGTSAIATESTNDSRARLQPRDTATPPKQGQKTHAPPKNRSRVIDTAQNSAGMQAGRAVD
ncbi:hypothetical protein NUU61_004905 [Penicillium alfredii]|uniref:Uncharacterized protein n=1 Tax=Penicillium alfredii TaxID=1506179 RepID=A0A9W9K743_9EURO|nr:uncharacterized protein NUU61_004905 [Penicillium alfredii]KAJ5095549.1 hypothetical protein NUU61_004905 [Penicillium alfredii]